MTIDNQRIPVQELTVEQFKRRTIKIGSLTGGVEKTITFDLKIENNAREHVRRTEEGTERYVEKRTVKYLVFKESTEELGDKPGELSDAANKRTIFTLQSPDDVTYREFVRSKEMYLVSWNGSGGVRVLSESELNSLLQNGNEHSSSNSPTDVLANALEKAEAQSKETQIA